MNNTSVRLLASLSVRVARPAAPCRKVNRTAEPIERTAHRRAGTRSAGKLSAQRGPWPAQCLPWREALCKGHPRGRWMVVGPCVAHSNQQGPRTTRTSSARACASEDTRPSSVFDQPPALRLESAPICATAAGAARRKPRPSRACGAEARSIAFRSDI